MPARALRRLFTGLLTAALSTVMVMGPLAIPAEAASRQFKFRTST